jgi:chemotaxis methyl-accepting protein methylase
MTDLWETLRARFAAWTGNTLSTHLAGEALARLENVARSLSVPARDCLAALDDPHDARQSAARDALIDRLVNRTTWFYRDARGIQALVAEMVRREKAAVRVWVIGCSTGQEPYTIAMAFLEAGIQPSIFATDVSREALAIAARGEYRDSEAARLPRTWRERHVETIGAGRVRVRPAVRERVNFAHHNLASVVPSMRPRWDAIVCRNVLLYFQRQRAVALVETLLSGGAYLLLSPVEEPLAWVSRSRSARRAAGAPVLLEPRPEPPRAAVFAPPPVRSAPSVPTPDARFTAASLEEACDLLQRDLAERALDRLDEAIQRDQLSAPAHLARGLALKRLARFPEAIRSLRCARFLAQGESWLAPYELAACLERIGEHLEAAEAYTHALGVLDGGSPAGLAPLGASLDALAHTAADTCRHRIAVLAGRGAALPP